VGSGRSAEEALQRARADAAASLSVQVLAETSDRQVDWNRRSGGTRTAGAEQRIEVITRSLVDRTMKGCERVQVCKSGAETVHLLTRCARQSAMERELRRAAVTLLGVLPGNATFMVLPTTDDGGLITGLGEYSSKLLNDIFDRDQAAAPRLRRTMGWNPEAYHDTTRKLKLTHVVRSEFLSEGGQRLRFRFWLMDVATDQPLSGSTAAFDFDLDPPHLELLDVRGPLFPLKAAMDLAGAQGTVEPPRLRLLETRLKEGQEVQIEFNLTEDSYVYLFDIYEDGQAALLIPNPAVTSNHFVKEKWHRIPDEAWRKAGMVIKACPVPGQSVTRESIKLVATATPLDLPLERFARTDLSLLSGGPKGTLAEIVKRLNQLKARGVPVATATAPYFIESVPEANSGCPK
jgi:hypothetical protein